MDSIRTIGQGSGLLQQSSGSAIQTRTSPAHLTSSEVDDLEDLMKMTRARYFNQTLPEGTPEMYALMWAKTAVKFGMPAFTRALYQVIERTRFFPDPLDIEELCRAIRDEDRDAADSRRILDQQDAWKAQWEKDMAEERANPRVRTEKEIALQLILDKAGADKRGPHTVTITDEMLEKSRATRKKWGITDEMMEEAREKILGKKVSA